MHPHTAISRSVSGISPAGRTASSDLVLIVRGVIRLRSGRPSFRVLPCVKPLLILMLCISNIGCIHSPYPNLPDDWRSKRVESSALEDTIGEASLQVLILYGSNVCEHSTLRLYCPMDGKGAAFWDPGGNYGELGLVKIDKVRAVVKGSGSGVNEYLQWRRNLSTAGIELFVWTGDQKLICNMYDQLMGGREETAADGFDSLVPSGACSFATSRFLRDYAADLMTIEVRGLPHNLSAQLYEYDPDHVYSIDPHSGEIFEFFP